MTPYTILSLIACTASLLTITYILLKRYGDRVSKTFIWLLLLCLSWSFSIYMMRTAANPGDIFLWAKIRYIPLLLLPAVLVYLVSLFPIKKTGGNTSIITALLLFTLVAFLPGTIILLLTDNIIKDVEAGSWGYHAVVGDGYLIFMLYSLILITYVIISLVQDYLTIKDKNLKNQVLWLLTACISLLLIENMETTLKITNTYLIPLNDILLIPMILSICYLAIKHRKPAAVQKI